ncbi:hypothetical protein BHE74_00024784, partial [Ensete ventricosum]
WLACEVAGCVASTARGGCLTRPLLHATAVSRLWQTPARPSLDATVAYARPIQRMA